MIRIDLARSSREELEKIVAERCSQFGSVSQVVIMRDTEHAFALAGVVMSDPAEAVAVLRNLGGSKLENMVVIRIEQQ